MSDLKCPQCGSPVSQTGLTSEATVVCPSCQTALQMPAPTSEKEPLLQSPSVASTVQTQRGAVCAICQSPFTHADNKTTCPDCHAEYHAECWQENGGCGVYGCSQVPKIEQRRAVEIPVSYWGQENKPCPSCGKEILAAAVRCRHCGAMFSSAKPEDTVTFNQRQALEQQLPKLKQTVVWIFVLSLLPCLAPIGGVWSLVWYPSHRQDLAALPSLYPALCKIAIVIGLGQTGLMALMGVLYSFTTAG